MFQSGKLPTYTPPVTSGGVTIPNFRIQPIMVLTVYIHLLCQSPNPLTETEMVTTIPYAHRMTNKSQPPSPSPSYPLSLSLSILPALSFSYPLPLPFPFPFPLPPPLPLPLPLSYPLLYLQVSRILPKVERRRVRR